MRLRRMHQKRMAQVDGACDTCREYLAARSRFSETFRSGQVSRRQTLVLRWCENPCDIEMRANANAGWRVTFANIGEKKQHQQGSSLGKHVDAPVQKIIGIAEIRRETAVHVPARVSWIVARRKSNREGPEVTSRPPSAWTDKLIECLVQDRHIGGSGKRCLFIHTEADHRLRPGCWVVLIAAGVPPEDRTALVCNLTRKSPLDFDEPIMDELPDLRIAQHRGRTRIKPKAMSGSLLVVHVENPTLFSIEGSGRSCPDNLSAVADVSTELKAGEARRSLSLRSVWAQTLPQI